MVFVILVYFLFLTSLVRFLSGEVAGVFVLGVIVCVCVRA